MISQADVIVIGAGGLGAATAFYLVKRGARSVALVDKYEIGSQTSPRAAGMVSCVRKSELMIELIKLAAGRIERFTEETGQPLDWVRSGSLKVARRAQDVTVIEGDIVRARRLGLDVERISPEEAHRLNPFLEPDGVAAVMRVGDDMYFNPAQVAVGFARGAEAGGAILLPHTAVTRVLIERGKVTGVETSGERSTGRSSSTPPVPGRARSPRPADCASHWCRRPSSSSSPTRCRARAPICRWCASWMRRCTCARATEDCCGACTRRIRASSR